MYVGEHEYSATDTDELSFKKSDVFGTDEEWRSAQLKAQERETKFLVTLWWKGIAWKQKSKG